MVFLHSFSQPDYSITPLVIIKPFIYGDCRGLSLFNDDHPPFPLNLPSSGQQVTARLSARKVSVAGGNRAWDPLVRDTITYCKACLYVVFSTLLLPRPSKSWEKRQQPEDVIFLCIYKKHVKFQLWFMISFRKPKRNILFAFLHWSLSLLLSIIHKQKTRLIQGMLIAWTAVFQIPIRSQIFFFIAVASARSIHLVTNGHQALFSQD
jgi:hypothetical protein